MDCVELRGLTFPGHHGAIAADRALGQQLVVDVRLGLDLKPAGATDNPVPTVGHDRVAETVRSVVEGPPFNPFEALADAIAASLFAAFPLVQRAEVRVARQSAPEAAASAVTVAIEIRRERAVTTASEPPSTVTKRGEPASGEPDGSVLSADAIRRLQASDSPLIEGLADPEQQIQPNGVDLTLESVWRIGSAGAIGRSNGERRIPPREPMEPDSAGWLALDPGTYIIRLREVVALPRDVMAFGRPRSSLLRCAAAIHTAVWDAGYRGRSEALLIVHGREGFSVAIGARVLQLVFLRLDAATHPYAGAYQNEHAEPS